MRSIKPLSFILLLSPLLLNAQLYIKGEPFTSTYSIVARDSKTGEMGVAVQSHWFSVGTIVAWGEAGVGVVATQSLVNPAFGPDGLKLLKTGLSPRQALNALLENDEGSEYRQLAILDKQGRLAVHTGEKCIPDAGHISGENFSAQANMMANNKVWGAMKQAFENSSELPLAERLVECLKAAQGAGGDIRGKQSAALLIVAKEASGKPWIDRKVDLRIDDHPNPIAELERLLKVHRAYEHMNRGDLAIEKGDTESALKEYGAAEAMFPENLEMKFWHAVSLINIGQAEAAKPMLKAIFKQDQNWKILLPRLVPIGLLNIEKDSLDEILGQ